MNWKTIGVLFLLALRLTACEKKTDDLVQPSFALEGNWKTIQASIAGTLQINNDSTFQVALAAPANIQASGDIMLANESKITFVNTAGNDSAAIDPYPGTYRYTISGDTAQFTVISDTLSRRMTLLSADWIRD